MTDIELKTLFDKAFIVCQVQHDDSFIAAKETRFRYARLIGAYEQLIKKLARSESDKRIVSAVLKDFSYDVLGKGE